MVEKKRFHAIRPRAKRKASRILAALKKGLSATSNAWKRNDWGLIDPDLRRIKLPICVNTARANFLTIASSILNERLAEHLSTTAIRTGPSTWSMQI